MSQRAPQSAEIACPAQLVALVLLYVLIARVGLGISSVGGFATLVWAPTGLSLAVLVLGGLRLWPAVALGAFLTNVWIGAPPPVALGIASGNTLEALFGALLLRRLPGFRGCFDRFVDVIALAVVAIACAPVSATLGTTALTLGGFVAATAFSRTWSAWWTGDALSALVVAPVIMTWVCERSLSTRAAKIAEAAALSVFLVACAFIVFSQSPEAAIEVPILQAYVLFLPILWAALRFGTRGASTGTLAIAVVAIWGTSMKSGPFVRADRTHSLAALYVFLGSLSLASLLLASVVAERERSRRALAESQALLARDVAERKRIEGELREMFERAEVARAEAQAATRAKDEFLAVLSHELRTPLQSMLGWTVILKARVHDVATVQKGLATIERNVKTQAQLIEDLVDVSRIVTGKLRLAREPVDLAAVVEAALEPSRVAATAKSVAIRTTIGPMPGVVIGDPGRLQQVVSNLLCNAVKFTPSGGSVGVTLDHEGAVARIAVEDTGRGISKDFLPHVFDRFRQAERTTTDAHGGLGLGLAIVRHLVELHGGTVGATSAGEGRGATFTVTLPLVTAERRAIVERRNDAANLDAADVVLTGVRVLVVDDDPDACELLETTLAQSGANVFAVGSARAALDTLASFRPDLLLSDIGMPGEDGYSLIRKVRERESTEGGHLPAVALTAFANQADREHALSLGFEAYLAKPTSPSDLTKTVAGLVGRTPS